MYHFVKHYPRYVNAKGSLLDQLNVSQKFIHTSTMQSLCFPI